MECYIYRWRAKRAGGRITIYGHLNEHADDQPIRVPQVDVIECAALNPIATDKDGKRYTLD